MCVKYACYGFIKLQGFARWVPIITRSLGSIMVFCKQLGRPRAVPPSQYSRLMIKPHQIVLLRGVASQIFQNEGSARGTQGGWPGHKMATLYNRSLYKVSFHGEGSRVGWAADGGRRGWSLMPSSGYAFGITIVIKVLSLILNVKNNRFSSSEKE